MEQAVDFNQWFVSIVFLGSGIAFGVIFEKIILTFLKAAARKTKWQGDDILISALRHLTGFWVFLVGLAIAIKTSPISEHWKPLFNKIILVIAIASVTLFTSRLIVGFIMLLNMRTKTALPSASIFSNIARILIYIFGFMVILQALNISIAPLLTALGVGGLAIALALQDTLSNLFSGIHILASRQIKPGDYVKLEGLEEGYVIDISWRNTTIRSRTNNIIVVPNGKLASAIITNYHLPGKEMTISIQLGVAYDSDLEKVERISCETAKEILATIPGGKAEFEPFIRYHTFGDFSINFSVMLMCNEYTDQFLLKHEFIKKAHIRFKQEGIEIPYPVRNVFLKPQGQHPIDAK